MINFDVNDHDAELIGLILDRAEDLNLICNGRSNHELDLIATHLNGCPMDFQRLLDVDDFNFTHDFIGIYRHIDRNTGKLTRCFPPRFRKR